MGQKGNLLKEVRVESLWMCTYLYFVWFDKFYF